MGSSNPLSQQTAIASQIGGLISHPRGIGAIRQAGNRLCAPEEEGRGGGVAGRAPTSLFRQLEQAAPLAERNDIIDQLGFGLYVEVISVREGGVAAHRRPRKAHHM